MSKLEQRANVVKYLYQLELLGGPFTSDQAFETGDYTSAEIKIIEAVLKNYDKLKKLISKFLANGWTYSRIAPLERAILLLGSFEMAGRDKGLIINEMIILAKGYIPGDSYKFINSVLQKVGDFYEQIKAR